MIATALFCDAQRKGNLEQKNQVMFLPKTEFSLISRFSWWL
jgi:hypothetical protein